MAKREELIIDIETMGTEPDTVVLSIGALFVSLNPGVQIKESPIFYEKINLNCPHNKERSKTESTAIWWSEQDPEVAAEALDGTESLQVIMQRFYDWIIANCNPKYVKPWGNGSVFDVVILENAFKQVGIEVPWKYWNVRDVRTIVDLAEQVGHKKSLYPFHGKPHHALHDALHEAQIVIGMRNYLLSRKL